MGKEHPQRQMVLWHLTLTKLCKFNGLEATGGARSRLGPGPGSALGAEIPFQRVYGCVQHKMTIRASLQMALDFAFDGGGESPLQVPANQMNSVFAVHIPRPSNSQRRQCRPGMIVHFPRQTRASPLKMLSADKS